MIGQKGIPTLFGGIERHVEEISTRLANEKRCQVFVYARKYYSLRQIKKYKKVNVIYLPSIRTKHFDAISHVFFSTLYSIFILKPNIIHYHGIGPALCLWIPKVFAPKIKIIFTFHCCDYYHKKWGKIAQLFLMLGESIGCRLADEVIPVSSEIRDYIKKKYKRETEFIPHGVSQKKYLPVNKIKKWGLIKGNYILTVSRLIPHKGLHYLIKSYQKIKTDKKLVIVGPSFYTENYRKELLKIADNNPNIIFLGAQHGKILDELYSNAFLFVHPSEQEGLPFAVLEAGSFGLPLLLSAISAHLSIFDNLPFFFKNKNIKDLKNNLEFLLNYPKASYRRVEEIKKYIQQNYNWDKIIKKIILRYT